jgi:hypothetical protein
MNSSAKGWAVAAQQEELKLKMHTDKDLSFEQRKRDLAYVYKREADSKEEKKSVIAQIMFFADREICHE